MHSGKLYLIPTTLGDNEPLEVLPLSVKQTIEKLTYFIVENEKTARRFIKKISPRTQQSSLEIVLLNKYSNILEIQNYLDVCASGKSVGLLSEAGVPAVADPGNEIVKLAHSKNIQVVPLVGPSSILMALMSSGLNGQSFAFSGYLPIDSADRKKEIKNLEKISQAKNQTQIFIETPYRNEKLFDTLVKTLSNDTLLCIAVDITLSTEFIKTFTVKDWKSYKKPNLHKRPAIFILHKK